MGNDQERPAITSSNCAALLCDEVCPECNQDYNGLSIDSSYELGISRIECSECGFSFEDNLCEEDLTENFFQIYKKRGKDTNL